MTKKKEVKIGFAKPEKGKVIHVVVDGLQACDKKNTLTPDPELQVNSVTCKKCQRFAFFKAIAGSTEKKTVVEEKPKPKKEVKKKKAQGKKAVIRKTTKETPEEKAERIATQADRKAEAKAKEKKLKKPGPVKHTVVNKNRKERKRHKQLVKAIQESLVDVLEIFRKDEIEQVSLMRVFTETQTLLKSRMADAIESKDEKILFEQQWMLDWRHFTTAFESIQFARLRGKDQDKGKVILLYDDKAKKSSRKIKRRSGKSTEKVGRTITRRVKPKEEKKKVRKITRRHKVDQPKKEKKKKKTVEINVFQNRIGTMNARIDELMIEGFYVKDGIEIIMEEFNRTEQKARRKVRSHPKWMARKRGIRVSYTMGKDPEDDFIKVEDTSDFKPWRKVKD